MVLSGRPGGRSPRTTLVVLTLISITVIAMDAFGFGPVESLRSGVATVFSPVKAVGETVFGPVGDVWDATVNRRDLRDENQELRDEVDRLESELAQTQQFEALVDQLAGATNLVVPGEIPRVTAEISANPVSNFETEYSIDKGASDGIAPGMPVVFGTDLAGTTLVGVVTEVSLVDADVQLITDPEFRVGVRISPSGDVGVARGQGPGEPLLVDTGIQARSEVQAEDRVTTSGVETSLFPAFLNIGLVRDTREAPNPLEQEVLVDPSADLETLTYVSVLRVDQAEPAEAPSTTTTTAAPG